MGRDHLHIRNCASCEQVHVYNIPIDWVPQVRRERTPEATHDHIYLGECGSRPWVHYLRTRKPRRRRGNKVGIFCKVSSTISEVEVLNLGEDD